MFEAKGPINAPRMRQLLVAIAAAFVSISICTAVAHGQCAAPDGPEREFITFGPYVSIQVNVDVNGEDKLGDAANEPSLGIDPTDPTRMVVGWREFPNTAEGAARAGYSYSHDGGQTWSATGILEDDQIRTDPVVSADSDGVFYYLSYLDGVTTHVFVSHDGGVTWSMGYLADGHDKPWLAIDPVPSPSGSILYQHFGTNSFIRSFDGGVHWEEDSIPFCETDCPRAFSLFGGTSDVGLPGHFYLTGTAAFFLPWQNDANDCFWFARSTNARVPPPDAPDFEWVFLDIGGARQGPQSSSTPTTPNPGGIKGQVYTKVVPTAESAKVFVLCSVVPGPGPCCECRDNDADPMDVHFVRSMDGGDTWDPPIRINDDIGTAWQWFAMMDVAPNGRIDAVWNDTRNGFVHCSELFYSYSLDDGQTWSTNVQVTPGFNSLHGMAEGQTKLGDYYDIVSDNAGAHVVYAATFPPVQQQNIYYLRLTPPAVPAVPGAPTVTCEEYPCPRAGDSPG